MTIPVRTSWTGAELLAADFPEPLDAIPALVADLRALDITFKDVAADDLIGAHPAEATAWAREIDEAITTLRALRKLLQKRAGAR